MRSLFLRFVLLIWLSSTMALVKAQQQEVSHFGIFCRNGVATLRVPRGWRHTIEFGGHGSLPLSKSTSIELGLGFARYGWRSLRTGIDPETYALVIKRMFRLDGIMFDCGLGFGQAAGPRWSLGGFATRILSAKGFTRVTGSGSINWAQYGSNLTEVVPRYDLGMQSALFCPISPWLWFHLGLRQGVVKIRPDWGVKWACTTSFTAGLEFRPLIGHRQSK